MVISSDLVLTISDQHLKKKNLFTRCEQLTVEKITLVVVPLRLTQLKYITNLLKNNLNNTLPAENRTTKGCVFIQEIHNNRFLGLSVNDLSRLFARKKKLRKVPIMYCYWTASKKRVEQTCPWLFNKNSFSITTTHQWLLLQL